jgi:hypothetical protein
MAITAASGSVNIVFPTTWLRRALKGKRGNIPEISQLA